MPFGPPPRYPPYPRELQAKTIGQLTDFDVKRTGSQQRFVHRDGKPFTAEETELIGSATDEDLRAAAGQLAAAPQRLTEMIAPYIRATGGDAAGGDAAGGDIADPG